MAGASYVFGAGALDAMGNYLNRSNDNERFIAHSNNPGGHWGIWDMQGGGNIMGSLSKSDAGLITDRLNGEWKRSLMK
jgi:hypothetical protein